MTTKHTVQGTKYTKVLAQCHKEKADIMLVAGYDPMFKQVDSKGNVYYVERCESMFDCHRVNEPYFEDQKQQLEFRDANPSLYFRNHTIREIAKEYEKEAFIQLAVKAKEGDMGAIKEFNRLTIPANGFDGKVNFSVPDNIEDMSTKELKRLQFSVFKAYSEGIINEDTFKSVTSAITNMTVTTEAAELEAKIESMQNQIDDAGNSGTIIHIEKHRKDADRGKDINPHGVIVTENAAKGSGQKPVNTYLKE